MSIIESDFLRPKADEELDHNTCKARQFFRDCEAHPISVHIEYPNYDEIDKLVQQDECNCLGRFVNFFMDSSINFYMGTCVKENPFTRHYKLVIVTRGKFYRHTIKRDF